MKMVDEFPIKPNAQAKAPESEKDKNSKDAPKINLTVNEFDLSCQQMISGLRVLLKKFEFDNECLQSDEISFWKLSANESIMNDKLLEIKSLKLDQLKNLSITEIQACMKKEYVIIINNFIQGMKETYDTVVKHFKDSLADMCNKSLAVSQMINSDPNIYQSTTSVLTQSRIEHKLIGNYEVVSEKWELFHNFNQTFNKGNSQTSFQLLKAMKAKFMAKEKLKIKEEYSVQIDKIRISLVEDEIRQKISVFLENIYASVSSKIWIGILEKFCVIVETPTNNFVLLRNSNTDFSLKFYGEMVQENILSFYLKSDNYDLYGDSEMWEAIDNRLKALLKEFNNDQGFTQASEKWADDKMDGPQEMTLNEAVVESFCINLKLGILSHPLRMEINPTYSLELFKDIVTFEEYGDKVLENFLASVQTFCRSLAPHQAVKIISFLMWRILKFIVLKRNFKRVNNSIYKILKSQLNRVFIR